MFEVRQHKKNISRKLETADDIAIIKNRNSRKTSLNITQMLCYSITHSYHRGNALIGSPFPPEVVNSFFQTGIFNVTAPGVFAYDELRNGYVVRQASLTNFMAEADHIVPKKLGGGGLYSNCRIINAHDNRSRGDDFYKYNTRTVKDVVIVDDSNLAHTDMFNFLNDSNLSIILNLINRWPDPWLYGNIHCGLLKGKEAIDFVHFLQNQ